MRKMRNIKWTPELKDKFEQYKTGRMERDGIMLICYPPLTMVRFLLIVGINPYLPAEKVERTHDEVMVDFDKWLSKKTWK